jgi:phosphohistidine phosphatase SixA
MPKRYLFALVLSLISSLTAQSSFANELLIWDQLQGKAPKGYVLLFRHSLAPGVGDPANFKLNDCSTQRNLSAEGREDAKEIGKWLQRREVKIARVESSRWCRAKETAQLLNLGKVRLNPNLDSLFQEADATKHPQTSKVRQQIINHRNKTGLLVLVGHYVNIAALTGVGVDSGEGILVRADNKGVIKVVGATPDLGD